MKRSTMRERAGADPGLLTTTQAAARIGVSTMTLYAWRRKGTGPPAVRVGKMIRYRASDLDEFVK